MRVARLYIPDEPTVGPRMADVERLVRVLHRLVDAGHSVILVKHNLDAIAEARFCYIGVEYCVP